MLQFNLKPKGEAMSSIQLPKRITVKYIQSAPDEAIGALAMSDRKFSKKVQEALNARMVQENRDEYVDEIRGAGKCMSSSGPVDPNL